MNGVHDPGGMHGLGRVDVEGYEYMFCNPWEKGVFGTMFTTKGTNKASSSKCMMPSFCQTRMRTAMERILSKSTVSASTQKRCRAMRLRSPKDTCL